MPVDSVGLGMLPQPPDSEDMDDIETQKDDKHCNFHVFIDPVQNLIRDEKIKTVISIFFFAVLAFGGVALLLSTTGLYSIPSVTPWAARNITILCPLTFVLLLTCIGGVIFYRENFNS